MAFEQAQRDLLGPLTEPEPHQLDGPGTSFQNPQRSLSMNLRRHQNQSSTGSARTTELPSPPNSSRSLHPTNPFYDHGSNHGSNHHRHGSRPSSEWAPAHSILSRPMSSGSHQSGARSPEPGFRPDSGYSGHSGYQGSSMRRSSTTAQDPRYNQGSQDYGRGSSMRRSNTVARDPRYNQSSQDYGSSGLNRSTSAAGGGVHRRGSLSLKQRYPGDMSHRPLDQSRRDHRAADRAQPIRSLRNNPAVDIIDRLDTSGPMGGFHHEGPYDSTLARRNTNPMNSPMAAVESSNKEALRATPNEYINRSLRKKVPLEGIASVPPGGVAVNGQRMNYREGADLMREEDAAGGPYRRYVDERYHPDDLKGKGEPSFSVDRAVKEYKALSSKNNNVALSAGGVDDVEMKPQRKPSVRIMGRLRNMSIGDRSQRVSTSGSGKTSQATTRVRSISDASSTVAGPSGMGPMSPTSPMSPGESVSGSGLQRSHTTGGGGKRFGNLRRLLSFKSKKNKTDGD